MRLHRSALNRLKRVLRPFRDALLAVGAVVTPARLARTYIKRRLLRGSIRARPLWVLRLELAYVTLSKLGLLDSRRACALAECVKDIGDSYLLEFDDATGMSLLERYGKMISNGIDSLGADGRLLYAWAVYLLMKDDVRAAAAALERSAQHGETTVEALGLLVQTYGELRDSENARRCFDRLLELGPAKIPNVAYYVNAPSGELGGIWRSYRAYRTPHPAGCPQWNGEPLGGKRLLVVAVGGIGDEIRFSSVYDDLGRLGGRCTIACEPRLQTVLRRSFPSVEIIPAERTHIYHLGTTRTRECVDLGRVEGVDYYTNNLAVLEFLRRDSASFTRGPSRLLPLPSLVEQWKERLARLPGSGRRVGICWRSGIRNFKRRRDHFLLRELAPLLRAGDCTFVALQYDGQEEIRELQTRSGITVVRLDADLKDDFESLAAVIANLDLVISSPTNVAELAGSVGTEAWMITATAGLQFTWRMTVEGKDLVFPNMRHFNAAEFGGRDPLVRAVRDALETRWR